MISWQLISISSIHTKSQICNTACDILIKKNWVKCFGKEKDSMLKNRYVWDKINAFTVLGYLYIINYE